MPEILTSRLTDRVLTDKERKNLLFLELIRKNGPISRTDIARMTDNNIVTVSNYINHFLKKELVIEKELDISTGGRKPILLTLNKKAGAILGVGFNSHNAVALLVDLECRVLAEVKRNAPQLSKENVEKVTLELAEEAISSGGIEKKDLFAVGVAAPDSLPSLFSAPAKQSLEENLKAPLILEKSPNAAVLAEKLLGLDRDVRHMLFIVPGVGCGVLIDGEIYRGASGFAGQVDIHEPDGKQGDFSKSFHSAFGPWEPDMGLQHSIEKRIQKGETSTVAPILQNAKPGTVQPEEYRKALDKNDKVVQAEVNKAGEYLGRRISTLVNHFNPEIIVMGGGIEVCGDVLMEGIKSAVKRYSIPEASENIRIIPSAFGDRAVSLGVAGIVCREVFAQA